MLLKWTEFPFKPEEQLLGMLFDGGMLTKEQIEVLSGWTKSKVDYCFRRVRKKAHPEEGPLINEWFLPGSSKGKAYSLSVGGVRYVHEMMELEAKLRTVSESQILHYMGVNNVTVRAVRRFGRENVTWLSSREVMEDLYLNRRLFTPNDEKGRLIRPDAFIEVKDRRSAWIEFDNATESTAKLEGKFRAYVNLYREFEKHQKEEVVERLIHPVLWITPTKERRDFLQRVYMALKKQMKWIEKPLQLFFVEGDEQEWIGQKNSVSEVREQA